MSRLPTWAALALLGASLLLGALSVWERAVIVHLGAEVRSLRQEAGRLEEEGAQLRMGLSRALSVQGLSRGGSLGGEAWVLEGGRTQDVVERARKSGDPAAVRAGR